MNGVHWLRGSGWPDRPEVCAPGRGTRQGASDYCTRAAIARTDLYMLQDAPGGLFVVLDEAPLGSLLPTEHVLLVAVQHVTGMWVLSVMRMKAYCAAIKVEAADAAKFGSLGAALTRCGIVRRMLS